MQHSTQIIAQQGTHKTRLSDQFYPNILHHPLLTTDRYGESSK